MLLIIKMEEIFYTLTILSQLFNKNNLFIKLFNIFFYFNLLINLQKKIVFIFKNEFLKIESTFELLVILEY